MSDPSGDTDPDLRDVFRLLYADDEWAFTSDTSDTEEDQGDIQAHPPLNSFIPDVEVDLIDSSLSKEENIDEIKLVKERYTRKRFLEALDSLISSPTSPSKKSRIYTSPPTTHLSPSIILCTQPIPQLPSSEEYLPYSPLGLLSRLRTYQIHRYSPLLPNHLSPIKASLHGWINSSRNTLHCRACECTLKLDGMDEIRDERVREEVSKRLSKGFESGHKKDCAWRIRRSPDELYDQLRNLLHPLISSNLSPLAQNIHSSIPTLSTIQVKSPLSPTQEDCLIRSIRSHQSPSERTDGGISRESILSSLFGWYPYYPKSLPSDQIKKEQDNTEIIHCRICQRRIGLWAFAPGEQGEKKVFDLVSEHLNWCPLNTQQNQKTWWEDCLLLKEKVSVDSGITRDWVKLSDKLEKKPWRR
ncbi:hypothetical protein V866_001295 [Kwoniella sp. B9012]